MEKLNRDEFTSVANFGALRGRDLISLCSTDKKASERCDDAFYERQIEKEDPAYQEVFNKLRQRLSPRDAYIKLFSLEYRHISSETITDIFDEHIDEIYPGGPYEFIVPVQGTFDHFVSIDYDNNLYIDFGNSGKSSVKFRFRKMAPLVKVVAAFSSNFGEYCILIQDITDRCISVIYSLFKDDFQEDRREATPEILQSPYNSNLETGLTEFQGFVFMYFSTISFSYFFLLTTREDNYPGMKLELELERAEIRNKKHRAVHKNKAAFVSETQDYIRGGNSHFVFENIMTIKSGDIVLIGGPGDKNYLLSDLNKYFNILMYTLPQQYRDLTDGSLENTLLFYSDIGKLFLYVKNTNFLFDVHKESIVNTPPDLRIKKLLPIRNSNRLEFLLENQNGGIHYAAIIGTELFHSRYNTNLTIVTPIDARYTMLGDEAYYMDGDLIFKSHLS